MFGKDDEAVDIRRRLISTWLDAGTQESQPELLPDELSTAACAVLGADAVGLSLLSERYRIPLGASSVDAAQAEQLQFTVGDGPCLTASRERRTMRMDEAEIRARWPVYYTELTRVTPYRSLVCVPTPQTTGFSGAMDVYFTNAAMPSYEVMTDAEHTANEISVLLTVADRTRAPTGDTSALVLPSWMEGHTARDRMDTWIAIGLLMAVQNVRSAEALDVLRAYAYGRNTTSDDVTSQLTDGSLDPREIMSPHQE